MVQFGCRFVLYVVLESRGSWNECYGSETNVTTAGTYVMGIAVDGISVAIDVMSSVMKGGREL